MNTAGITETFAIGSKNSAISIFVEKQLERLRKPLIRIMRDPLDSPSVEPAEIEQSEQCREPHSRPLVGEEAAKLGGASRGVSTANRSYFSAKWTTVTS